ncbi:MAG: metallophosphoesterase family protein [Catalinimonas sp.]
MKRTLALSLLAWLVTAAACSQPRAYRAPKFAHDWSAAGVHPDHIVLSFAGDPATSAAVTWRTSTEVPAGVAEIAPATAAPKFWRNARTVRAETEVLDARDFFLAGVQQHYHTALFEDLQPGTLYAYRVGDGETWSEWIQFRTATRESEPFSFLYVGDAQNFILELWSRLIREGYRKAPEARFIVHAGDLVSEAHSERQWHEWFTAGGWIHRMLPAVPTPGNHEYQPRSERGVKRQLSAQWRPQFALPLNGPKGLEETVYYFDYQGVRIISLNTNRQQKEQVAWLEGVLADNPNRWTVVTYHHPLYSASAGRDNAWLRKLWKPLFDAYGVDLALQGHDHSYARGRVPPPGAEQNVVGGVNRRDRTGTVYVVSVSGGKMYQLRPEGWQDLGAERDRAAENTQLFQVINVRGDTLAYEAYTATGELYDAFELIKDDDGAGNRFVEGKQRAGSERRHNNTIPYLDDMPAAIRETLLKKYEGYVFEKILYVDEPAFRGYRVEMEQGAREVHLDVDLKGNILKETYEE